MQLIRPKRMLTSLSEMRKESWMTLRKFLMTQPTKQQRGLTRQLIKYRVQLRELLTLQPTLQTPFKVSCPHAVSTTANLPTLFDSAEKVFVSPACHLLSLISGSDAGM